MVPAQSIWKVLEVDGVRLFRSSKMTCGPWSQIGVDTVEDLEELEAGDFEKLEKILKKIPYKRLLAMMKDHGFTNVPSVSTCP